MCSRSPDSGELLTLAAALACALAKGRDAGQLGRMAAFFTLLGDSFALLALQPGRDGQDCPPEKPFQQEK